MRRFLLASLMISAFLVTTGWVHEAKAADTTSSSVSQTQKTAKPKMNKPRTKASKKTM